MPSVWTSSPAWIETLVGPWMAWMARAGTGAVTVSEMKALPLRPSWSLAVTGNDLLPTVVLTPTAVNQEKVPSPLSLKSWVAPPPIDVRAPVTLSWVLAGLLPGETETVSVVESPAETDEGFAVPEATGELGATQRCVADERFRGAGADAAKSLPLTSVSVQPLAARNAAVVLLSCGAAVAPSKKLAPS